MRAARRRRIEGAHMKTVWAGCCWRRCRRSRRRTTSAGGEARVCRSLARRLWAEARWPIGRPAPRDAAIVEALDWRTGPDGQQRGGRGGGEAAAQGGLGSGSSGRWWRTEAMGESGRWSRRAPRETAGAGLVEARRRRRLWRRLRLAQAADGVGVLGRPVGVMGEMVKSMAAPYSEAYGPGWCPGRACTVAARSRLHRQALWLKPA